MALLLMMLVGTASAAQVTINAPEKVKTGQEFTITVKTECFSVGNLGVYSSDSLSAIGGATYNKADTYTYSVKYKYSDSRDYIIRAEFFAKDGIEKGKASQGIRVEPNKTPSVPEFPSYAMPVITTLGIFLILRYRKND